MPGVRATGLISDLPLTGENNNNSATAGDRTVPPISEWQMINYRSASNSYFKAAEIPPKGGETMRGARRKPGRSDDQR